MSKQKDRDRSGANDVHDADRRFALKGIASVGAIGTLGISTIPLGCSGASNEKSHIHSMAYENWNQYVGTDFQANGPALDKSADQKVSATLRLESVTDFNHHTDDHPRPSDLRPVAISLLFSSDRDIPNMTYDVKHGDLGTAHLFLHHVPRDEHADKQIYEAVLN